MMSVETKPKNFVLTQDLFAKIVRENLPLTAEILTASLEKNLPLADKGSKKCPMKISEFMGQAV